jgi:hypothetical protein
MADFDVVVCGSARWAPRRSINWRGKANVLGIERYAPGLIAAPPRLDPHHSSLFQHPS